jgi:hypothetical protein
VLFFFLPFVHPLMPTLFDCLVVRLEYVDKYPPSCSITAVYLPGNEVPVDRTQMFTVEEIDTVVQSLILSRFRPGFYVRIPSNFCLGLLTILRSLSVKGTNLFDNYSNKTPGSAAALLYEMTRDIHTFRLRLPDVDGIEYGSFIAEVVEENISHVEMRGRDDSGTIDIDRVYILGAGWESVIRRAMALRVGTLVISGRALTDGVDCELCAEHLLMVAGGDTRESVLCDIVAKTKGVKRISIDGSFGSIPALYNETVEGFTHRVKQKMARHIFPRLKHLLLYLYDDIDLDELDTSGCPRLASVEFSIDDITEFDVGSKGSTFDMIYTKLLQRIPTLVVEPCVHNTQPFYYDRFADFPVASRLPRLHEHAPHLVSSVVARYTPPYEFSWTPKIRPIFFDDKFSAVAFTFLAACDHQAASGAVQAVNPAVLECILRHAKFLWHRKARFQTYA